MKKLNKEEIEFYLKKEQKKKFLKKGKKHGIYYFGKKKRQTNPVSLPGRSYGQKSLVGGSPCGCKESGTERLTQLLFM